MLYYSHVNEDNRVERELLQQELSPTVIAIAGSGERVLALMDIDWIKKIIIVDSNSEALFLMQLKIAAITRLTTLDYLKFIGHYYDQKTIRINHFEKIKNELENDCRLYWEKNRTSIGNGILNAGHFELFLSKVRPILNSFLGKKFSLIFKNQNSQLKYFPNFRWKLITYFFSQKWIYKLLGNRDLAFISADARNKTIPEAITKIIKEEKTNASFIMHLIFKGNLQEMGESQLPPSLQEKTINDIRKRILNKEIVIEYWYGDVLELLKDNTSELETPIFYSLSDILSFESIHYLDELIDYCMKDKNNIIIFRSFLRNLLTKRELTILSKKHRIIEEHSKKEATRMYQVFSVKNVS